jgi:phosphomannomutase
MNEKIFKTYDVRGVYNEEFDEKDVYKIGRAIVTFLEKENPKIVLGRDGRESSPVIFDVLKKGILDSGGDVINTGISNTPLLNFAVAKHNFDGGVMVTASHNPPQFNGLKIIREKALQVYGEDLQKIKEIVLREDFQNKEGREEEKSFLNDYLENILFFTGDLEGMKVVIDCGNGVGGVTAVPFFLKLKAETFFLYEEVDGFFPNHLPDPGAPGSLEAVREKIKKEKADVGIVFDGDADRCVLLDERGEVVSADLLLCLLAKDEINDEEKIYYDLRFSKVVKEKIEKWGGVPVMMRVGNPFYKEMLVKEGGAIGAELSGHIMFQKNFGIDDGLFASVMALNIIKGKKFSELLLPFKKYYQTEEINLKVENKKEVLRKVEEYFSDGENIKIDGVYIKYEDWWFNLRESNTEDLVRLRIEAENKELLEKKKEELINVIK